MDSEHSKTNRPCSVNGSGTHNTISYYGIQVTFDSNDRILKVEGCDPKHAGACFTILDEDIPHNATDGDGKKLDNDEFAQKWNEEMGHKGAYLCRTDCDICDTYVYAWYEQEDSNQPAYDCYMWHGYGDTYPICSKCDEAYAQQCAECSECELREWDEPCSHCGHEEGHKEIKTVSLDHKMKKHFSEMNQRMDSRAVATTTISDTSDTPDINRKRKRTL